MAIYLHFKSKIQSRQIIKALPIKDMLFQYYPAGHCMDIDNFYDRVKEALV